MKVIFMGTPDFAVPSLKALQEDPNHEVVAVYTAPPKPKNRGQKVQKTAIHLYAEAQHLDIYNPTSLKSEEVQQQIIALQVDVIIVAAYGFIIPQIILDAKKYGCLNIHPSKLPRFRGAAPLQRTIIEGDKESAICIMQMDAGLDTGDILTQESFAIDDKLTLQELHDYTAKRGAELLIETLNNIDHIEAQPQKEDGLVYAHKLTKEEALIDFHKTAWQINCQIRGMNPWPGAYFKYKEENIKILAAKIIKQQHNYKAGTIIDDKLSIACGTDILQIEKLQKPGKKAMQRSEFLLGNNLEQGYLIHA